MIQPTMYFQLKNVPLFAGAYWIVEVSHAIANNSMTTTFKGVRMPKDSLPNPKDSFIATYRVLFDKILKRAVAKQKQIDDDLKSLAKLLKTKCGVGGRCQQPVAELPHPQRWYLTSNVQTNNQSWNCIFAMRPWILRGVVGSAVGRPR